MADPGVVTLISFLSRQTIVIDGGAVLELDGNFSSDRIKRLTFDRLRSVTSSVSILYGRAFVAVLLLVVAVFLFIVTAALSIRKELDEGMFATVGLGFFILILAVIIMVNVMLYRRCQIRIESNVGPPINVVGSASKRRVNAFLQLLAKRVREYQSTLR